MESPSRKIYVFSDSGNQVLSVDLGKKTSQKMQHTLVLYECKTGGILLPHLYPTVEPNLVIHSVTTCF